MNHLMNVLDGIASVFDLAPRPGVYAVRGDGFSRDQKRLQGDARKVGNDMRKAVRQYGKQGIQSTR